MNYLIAIIKPHRLQAVREALEKTGVTGLTVAEVKGHGRQKGHTEIYRGAEYQVNYLPKLRIDIALDSKLTAAAVDAITGAAATNQIGDGKVFVLPLEDATRIRTGETGRAAL